MKTWNERSEDSYKSDLQGVTEMWAVEEDAKRADNSIDGIIANLEELTKGRLDVDKAINIAAYLTKKKLGKKVSGTRFCILIKGERKKPDYYGNDPEALYITYSPLIRGYKNVGTTEVSYAFSWFYPNPSNKSGKSILGKGWETFNVWESDISVKQWVEALAEGKIQPECPNPVKGSVVTPVEYFRSEEEIETAISEIREQELRIHISLELIDSAKLDDSQWMITNQTNAVFPHIRKH